MRLETLLEYNERPPIGSIVVLPFANQEIIDWLGTGYISLAYAESPRTSAIFQRDCFNNPPKFQGSYVICYPPWTKKNDSADKAIFDRYGVDTLYKCFIKIIMRDQPLGGTIIIPLRFLTGSRDSEKRRRKECFSLFKLIQLTVFSDNIIGDEIPLVLQFQRRTDNYSKTEICKTILVSKEQNTNLIQKKETVWHINGTSIDDIFIKEADPFLNKFIEKPEKKKITVYVNALEEQTSFYLNKSDKIGLLTTPTDNTIKIAVKGFLSKRLKEKIVNDFNSSLTEWSNNTQSLFLPFIMINGKKISTINVELVLEWIERIIWSYFIKKQ